MHTVKIYHYQSIQCRLSVTDDTYEFVAQVYEFGEMEYMRFYKQGKDAVEVMKMLENTIEEALKQKIETWDDLSMCISSIVEKDEDLHPHINRSLLKVFITNFIGHHTSTKMDTIMKIPVSFET